MKKYNVKKVDNSVFYKMFVDYLSEVDPEFLSELSGLTGRSLDAKKDTEDYNMSLVSDLLDKTARLFMEGGQSEIKNGDLLKVDAQIEEIADDSSRMKDLIQALNTGDYESFPFSFDLVKELRAKFLVKTEKSDTFKSLMAEVDSLISKYLPIDGDWALVKKCINKSRLRIFNEDLNFLNPPEGEEQGELVTLTKEEAFKFGLNNEVKIDKRKDNHDLLALKEFVSMLKGNDVDQLSVGPGFFNKYMPEFLEEGIRSIMLVVEDNKLKEIRVHKPEDIMFAKHDYLLGEFSPAEAVYKAHKELCFKYQNSVRAEMKFKNHNSIFYYVPFTEDFVKDPQGFSRKYLVKNADNYHFFLEQDKSLKDFTIEFESMEPKIVKVNDKSFNLKEGLDIKDKSIYIIVDGNVKGESSNYVVNYENVARNDKNIAAGETFLMKKIDGQETLTRIYFTPYKPSDLNLIFQTGSVVFGSNEQSLHSALTDTEETRDLARSPIADRDFLKEFGKKGQDLLYDDAMAAWNVLDGYKNKRKQILNGQEAILREGNEEQIYDLLTGHYGYHYFITKFLFNHQDYSRRAGKFGKMQMEKFINDEKYLPLSHRFSVKKYVDEGEGLVKDKQKTFLSVLGQKLKGRKDADVAMMYLRHREAQQLMDEGMSYEEAIKTAYTESEANEILNRD